MMRTLIGAWALLMAAISTAGGQYDDYEAAKLLELSNDMATCAGRQEAMAKELDKINNPANAKLSRHAAQNFNQCAWYLRFKYISKLSIPPYATGEEMKEAIDREVAASAEFGELRLTAAAEFDNGEEITKQMSACRALDEELSACSSDQHLFLEESKRRGQKEATPSQPELTQAN